MSPAQPLPPFKPIDVPVPGKAPFQAALFSRLSDEPTRQPVITEPAQRTFLSALAASLSKRQTKQCLVVLLPGSDDSIEVIALDPRGVGIGQVGTLSEECAQAWQIPLFDLHTKLGKRWAAFPAEIAGGTSADPQPSVIVLLDTQALREVYGKGSPW